MQKIVKKYGDSLIVRFTPDEIRIYDLREDDIIEFTITKVGELKNKGETDGSN